MRVSENTVPCRSTRFFVPQEDKEGMETTGALVRDCIQQLRNAGLEDSQIVLGGFSMGGNASLYTANTGDDLLGLAGTFSLSSWVTT
jgi:predicted esterase